MAINPLGTIRRHGFAGFLTILKDQAIPPRANSLELARQIVRTGKGLEIGGPSPAFQSRGILPVYQHIDVLDNCNFSTQTTWEGEIGPGETFEHHPDKRRGRQYISEAAELEEIETGIYDFLLSSHVIEHLANPIQGLTEWLRVLKSDGHLILLVPHYKKTFDHRRPVTSLHHLQADFAQRMGEDDLSHLEEILEHHDLSRDPGSRTLNEFVLRSQRNFENRCLHQHVFDNQLVIDLMSHMNLQIRAFENARSNHILLIAQKSCTADNSAFAASNAENESWDDLV